MHTQKTKAGDKTGRSPRNKVAAQGHFLSKRQKFSEDYFEMGLERFGKRKSFGKRQTVDDLKDQLQTPYS